MFVTMCALAGCDYVDVEAVNYAHRLVARYKDRKKVLRALKCECAACRDDCEARGADLRPPVGLRQKTHRRCRRRRPWSDFLGAPLDAAVAAGIARARVRGHY